MAILRLLTMLHTPDIQFREVEKIISQYISLSYKILRLINSSFFAKSTKIKSIHQALTLLGIRQIRDWVSLLFLSQINDKPRDIMITAMVRAKMCELLSRKLKYKGADRIYCRIILNSGCFSGFTALRSFIVAATFRRDQ